MWLIKTLLLVKYTGYPVHQLKTLLIIIAKLYESKSMILGTDQNIDYLKTENFTSAQTLLDHNLESGLIPVITRPTRITQATSTLIDNIYITKDLMSKYVPMNTKTFTLNIGKSNMTPKIESHVL